MPANRGRLHGAILMILMLLTVTPCAFGQEGTWVLGAGIGRTIEPDELIYGRVLDGPLAGSAVVATAWGGRMLRDYLRLIGEFAIAREFEDTALLLAFFPGSPVLRRHRDMTLIGVVQYSPGFGLWLSAGAGMIQVRVREAAAQITRRREDGGLEGTQVGPWRTAFVEWQPAVVIGADGAIPLTNRLHIVPSFRLHRFEHDPGTDVSSYGLASYTARFAVGAEIGF